MLIRYSLVYFALFLVVSISAPNGFSLPQFAVMNNAKCISCHVAAQGGGLRNFRGWQLLSRTGLFKPDTVKLGRLSKLGGESNSLLNGRLTLGTDIRFQMARSQKSPTAKRRFFPMQAALYGDYRITDWIHTEVSYNFGKKKFNGQQSWTASAIIQPRYSFSQFRVGYFQPSIGIRYDDHTMLVRQIPGADGTTIIAPNYAEYGAEFTFNEIKWLTATAGIFDNSSLSQDYVIDNSGKQVQLVDKNKNHLSTLGRIVFLSTLFSGKGNVLTGGSYYANDDFSLVNAFGGLGFDGKIALLADFARSDKKNMRTTNTFSMELSYKVLDSLVAFVRGENGKTFSTISSKDIKTYTKQGVIGAEIFILPYIELRPEYRYMDTERFTSTRWAVQIHVFR